MTGGRIYRALVAVPALHLVAGDYLIHEPGGMEPYRVVRPVAVVPGAILAAEQDGQLEVIPADDGPVVQLHLVR